MEQAGNERDAALIHTYSPGMVEQYLAYKGILQKYFQADADDDTNKPLASSEELRQFFGLLRYAFDNLDMDQMEEVIGQMKQYRYANGQKELFSQLCGAVGEIDTDASEDILKMWETKL